MRVTWGGQSWGGGTAGVLSCVRKGLGHPAGELLGGRSSCIPVNELKELRTNKGAEFQRQQRNSWEPGSEFLDSNVFGSPAGLSGTVLCPTPRSLSQLARSGHLGNSAQQIPRGHRCLAHR